MGTQCWNGMSNPAKGLVGVVLFCKLKSLGILKLLYNCTFGLFFSWDSLPDWPEALTYKGQLGEKKGYVAETVVTAGACAGALYWFYKPIKRYVSGLFSDSGEEESPALNAAQSENSPGPTNPVSRAIDAISGGDSN